MELVGEIESAGDTVSQVEQKRALLRGLSKDYDVTAEFIMGFASEYNDTVSKLIVRETRLNDLDSKSDYALLTNENLMVWKCFQCGEVGHVAKSCQRNTKQSDDWELLQKRKSRNCFKCEKGGHIAKDCQSNGYTQKNNETFDHAWVSFATVSEITQKSCLEERGTSRFHEGM